MTVDNPSFFALRYEKNIPYPLTTINTPTGLQASRSHENSGLPLIHTNEMYRE
nr:hypothetical protein [Bacteroides congonensis]